MPIPALLAPLLTFGYTYDPVLDAFIPPKPDGNWTLNTETGLWE